MLAEAENLGQRQSTVTRGTVNNRSISVFALVPLVCKSRKGNVIGPAEATLGLVCTAAEEHWSWVWRWRGPSGLRWVWRNGRGPHLEGRQAPRGAEPLIRLSCEHQDTSWETRESKTVKATWDEKETARGNTRRLGHRAFGQLHTCLALVCVST